MNEPISSVTLSGGEYTAEIGLRGGRLLSLEKGGADLIVPASSVSGGYTGAVLAPWPNRVAGAAYSHDEISYTLDVTEEQTGAALHGLLQDIDFTLRGQHEDRAELVGVVEPTAGYPFRLEIVVFYRVSAGIGLACTLMARYLPDDADAAGEAPAREGAVAAENAAEAADDAAEAAEDADSAEDLAEASEAPETPEASEVSQADAGSDSDADADDAPDHDAEGHDAEEVDAEAEETEDAEADDAEAEDADVEAADAETTPAAEASEPAGTEASSAEPAPAADRGSRPATAPFGAGFHPYLSVAGASLKECRLRLPARTVLNAQPSGAAADREPVSGDFDLTRAPLLAGRRIDHAYTGLPEEGWLAELIHEPSGRTVRLISDAPWAQVFTGDTISRAGVAVEPMSCPPDAFNSGEDLIHLSGGEWFRMGYSIESFEQA